jgi:hypothetical protein
MCSQNAANAISGAQISKIFQGGMPPDPKIFHEVSATGIKLTLRALI